MKKINKTQQKSTLSEVESINQENGLTPIQEKAAALLVSGKTVTGIASELGLDRGTLCNWLNKITFKAYYNRFCDDVKVMVMNRIFWLYNDSLRALEDCLKSQNESIRLKAATWLIERIESQNIGETDPKEIIREECMHQTLDLND